MGTTGLSLWWVEEGTRRPGGISRGRDMCGKHMEIWLVLRDVVAPVTGRGDIT